MKLFVLADIHGNMQKLPFAEPVICDCDGIVLAGDITDFGGRTEARSVISALEVYGKPLLAVAGNCDLPGVEDLLRENNINLHGVCIEFGGFRFVGAGGSLSGTGAMPNESGDEEFRKTLEKAMAWQHGQAQLDRATPDNLVLVTHQPAWGCALDSPGGGRHAGRRAIRTFIEQYQPILAISGHMHEAYGIDQLGQTVLINPGPFRQGRYAVVELKDKHVQTWLYP